MIPRDLFVLNEVWSASELIAWTLLSISLPRVTLNIYYFAKHKRKAKNMFRKMQKWSNAENIKQMLNNFKSFKEEI